MGSNLVTAWENIHVAFGTASTAETMGLLNKSEEFNFSNLQSYVDGAYVTNISEDRPLLTLSLPSRTTKTNEHIQT